MTENKALDRDFDFDKAIEAIRRAAGELAKPEVRQALTIIGEGAEAVSAIQDAVKAVAIQDAVKAVAIQDAVKAVAIQDAVKAVAIQDAVKAVAIQDAVKAVAIQDAVKAVSIQDAAKAVAIQDAVKAVVGKMADQDWSTPDAPGRLGKILEAIRSAADAAEKRK
jgi:hypothetical protein